MLFAPENRGRGGCRLSLNRKRFFVRLGTRIRKLRQMQGHSQEDMISFGFSARHWQQIEAGRPTTVSTLLRICAVFEISIDRLVRGLDRGIYKD
ncbi:MAG TPA: helix-turn-helix transcriptional regulator [Terriglobales bacterium]|nr:helix-turn-helix transcriptional regulator [Terriglobales bacterium]